MGFGQAHDRRWIVVAASVVAVAGCVAAALLATGSVSPAVAFQPTGHWVFNRSEQVIAHVDAGTRQVDARVAVPNPVADPLFTLQGERQGFLVGRNAITTFGKSTLTVEGTVPAAGPEVPVGIEVIGGPYLVYRTSGVLVRLGEPPVTVRAGGALDRPTSTDDGTVWVHRPDTGAVCALRRGADALDCARATAPGLPGALTVATSSAAYLDTADDVAHLVDGAPRAPTAVGVDLPGAALIGDRDTRGRLPAVEPGRLVLADSAGVPTGAAGGPPVTVELGPDAFSAPVAADGIVAVVDQTRHRLLTFAVDGRALGAADLPADGASVARGGDGRIYVDDADGAATYVVGSDGSITPVTTGGPNNAVPAPSPDQLKPVPSPRPNDPPKVSTGGGGDPGEGSGPKDPGGEPPVAPLPPVAVTARLAGGGVTVTWRPGNNAPGVTYAVGPVAGGDQEQTSRTSAAFTGLVAGTTYRFTVTATNAGGTSGASAPSNPVTIPVPPPEAPLNLAVARDYFEGGTGLTKDITTSWTQPPLNGGQLVKYVVREYDRNGNTSSFLTTETTTTQARIVNGNACLTPFRIEVRAVTRAPGSAADLTGPAATVTSSKVTDCTIAMAVTAQATGATSAAVTLQRTSGNEYAPWQCELQFNGETKWADKCSTGVRTSPIAVTGLDPATTYSVVVVIKQYSDTTTNAVTVTTPAA